MPNQHLTGTILASLTIAMAIPPPPHSDGSLVATPATGNKPLLVTLSGHGSGHFEGVMVLDFGDGTMDDSISTIRGFRRQHLYREAGSYTARLQSGDFLGQHPGHLTTVARATITVHP